MMDDWKTPRVAATCAAWILGREKVYKSIKSMTLSTGPAFSSPGAKI
jgi:hypothetical protein